MKISVILTAYNEAETISKSIDSILIPNKNLWPKMQLIVVAPDAETINNAKQTLSKILFANYELIKDHANGKAAAINLAHQKCTGDIIFLTDGDMFISENAITQILAAFADANIGGVSGHPISLDNRDNFFGYISHLFCEAAHKKRLIDNETAMSGYLYAIRNIPELFPLPNELRAEDAYITSKILTRGYKIAYEPNALAYVRFPKNLNDWLKQKTRSLGGNIQLKRFTAELAHNSRKTTKTRDIYEDLKMVLFPILFATSLKELLYSLLLYPLRFYLWLKIYLNFIFNNYSKGAWERIDSSKR